MKGIVSGKNRSAGLLQLSVPTYQGASGSPVFNNAGEVIAVIRAVPTELRKQSIAVSGKTQEVILQSNVETMGLAIPINYAKPILRLAAP